MAVTFRLLFKLSWALPHKMRNMVERGHYLEILKRISSVFSWLRIQMHTSWEILLQRLRRYENQFDDWLYRRDITRRRIKHYVNMIVAFSIVGAFVVAVVVLFLFYMIPAAPQGVVTFVQFLYNLAEVFHLPNPGDFVTIVIAEIVAIFGSSIIIALISRVFHRRDSEFSPRPLLNCLPHSGRKLADGTRTLTIRVSNDGDTGAQDCQARITFRDIEKRDILDLPNNRYTPSNFETTISTDLLWNNSQKEVTIRAGDVADIEILTMIPSKGEVPAHFRVPSVESAQATVCLNCKTLFGKLRVVPLNGKPTVSSFAVKSDSYTEGWFVSLD